MQGIACNQQNQNQQEQPKPLGCDGNSKSLIVNVRSGALALLSVAVIRV